MGSREINLLLKRAMRLRCTHAHTRTQLNVFRWLALRPHISITLMYYLGSFHFQAFEIRFKSVEKKSIVSSQCLHSLVNLTSVLTPY